MPHASPVGPQFSLLGTRAYLSSAMKTLDLAPSQRSLRSAPRGHHHQMLQPSLFLKAVHLQYIDSTTESKTLGNLPDASRHLSGEYYWYNKKDSPDTCRTIGEPPRHKYHLLARATKNGTRHKWRFYFSLDSQQTQTTPPHTQRSPIDPNSLLSA